MKRKILSLVLCLALLFTCCFTGSVVVSAEEVAATDNLLVNGNFESYEGATPTNWVVKTPETTTAEIVEDVEIAEGVTANAIKFSSTAEPSGDTNRSTIYYNGTVSIEKNAKYTTTYWVKVTNNKGFRTYMYEPNYIDKDGNPKTSLVAQEGQNIYSYEWAGKDADGNPTTRVIRTDVRHFFKIAETGTIIDGAPSGGPSMFISRYAGNQLPLTPDYPAAERQGEWFKVVHTFETGNNDAHKADVAYQFAIPSAVDGEVWIADVQMKEERFYYPAVNDNELGTIAQGTKIPVVLGETITLTAEPLALNNFLGWYDGDTLVSEDAEISFVYNGEATPNYVAHFEENDASVVNTFEEGYVNGQALAQALNNQNPNAAGTDWTTESYLASEKENSGFYIDSTYGGTWRKAAITNAYAHSGKYSVKYSGQYGNLGYKFTGLEQNKDYTASVYAYLTYKAGTTDFAGVNNLMIIPTNVSSVAVVNGKNVNNTAAAIAAKGVSSTKVTSGWKKLEINFNSGDNTEVIFWIDSNGTDAQLYLDDYAITPKAIEYTPGVNDNTLGYVNTVKVRPGANATVTATAYGEATFDGWYNGDTLLSKDAKYTFVYSEEAANYEARFIPGAVGIDGGFENFANGTVLAQLMHNGMNVDWTPEAFLATSLDGNGEYFMESNNNGNYRKITVSNAYAYTGKQSLKFEGLYGYMGRKITGLQKNTDYVFSFYAMVTGNEAAKVNNIRITNTNTAPILPTGHSIPVADCIGGNSLKYGTLNKWEKGSVSFNTGDNNEVIVWLNHDQTGAIYLDDFAITRIANVTVENSAYGTATPGGKFAYNEKVTVTATPYEGNTFEGWYVGDELVSTNAEYTFTTNGDVVLTPVFDGKVYNHLVANGQDGTFENGSIDGIYFKDPEYVDCSWCYATAVSGKSAYEGNGSLELYARHRNTIIPLTNLEKYADYTISFYFYLDEIETPANNVAGAEMMKANVAAGVTTAEDLKTEGANITAVKTTLSEAKWQKVELAFNSGDNTELNLILRIANEKNNTQTYIDNLEVTCKGSELSFIPGNVDDDADNNVNLKDLVALAQYVAGWDTAVNMVALDVNGDGAVNLEDVAYFAQYLAGWDAPLSKLEYVPVVVE